MKDTGRRSALAPLGASLLARPAWAQGRTFVDSAGRKVVLPSTINRVFVAGPPASTSPSSPMAAWPPTARRTRR